MPDVAVTWLGHGSFRFDSAEGKRIYFDPWLEGNPSCPESEFAPERCDIIVLTHGHFDHIDAVQGIAEQFQPPIIGCYELCTWLAGQEIPRAGENGMGKGGTQVIEGISFTATNAFHSSSAPDGTYTGEPAGFVITFENGTRLYAAGDTNVFGDMALIQRLYEPDVAILPIGDMYTMGVKEAALALELLGVSRCIPCHWGTFPALTGTPDGLRELVSDVEIVDIAPGATITI
jgi:L-ascorbate metabolism protein UlaG (beta-lactamase superfamily)